MSELISAVKNLQSARAAKTDFSVPDVSVMHKTRKLKGKRSDPSFEQVTAYIRKDTYRQTKMALLQENDERDFSQLIEALLCAYLRTQKCK